MYPVTGRPNLITKPKIKHIEALYTLQQNKEKNTLQFEMDAVDVGSSYETILPPIYNNMSVFVRHKKEIKCLKLKSLYKIKIAANLICIQINLHIIQSEPRRWKIKGKLLTRGKKTQPNQIYAILLVGTVKQKEKKNDNTIDFMAKSLFHIFTMKLHKATVKEISCHYNWNS